MSVIKQKVSHAIVYVNTPRVAKVSHINAVVRICYSEKDSVSVAFTDMNDDRRGFEVPNAPLFIGGREIKIPIVTGELMTDLVTLGTRAMEAVKKEMGGTVPGGKVFKVHKVDGKSVVEEIEDQGAWL